ncbi:transcription factor tau subunit sfc1-like isoform X5 [Nicotiana tomentosiformis]|uniref:transcription factor tau subunit sfc1-like isoform X5 n=1 Tax=Nicotiana tomentosiformis TaxID=4098 RepID=UPI00051C0461|nr:general transcription factor 3C polypeptide 5-like isoform X5 [Nicotiana tomentosiformis]
MGIIKDGSVSGILPSNKVFAVHYPAYPSSMERAIETLGGIQGIVKARTSQSNKLELHFRPEDPYSHPAFGELRHRNNFLLKISKTKVRDVETADNSCGISMQSSGSPVNCEQEISRVEHSLAAEKVNESRWLSAGASKEFEVQNTTKLQIKITCTKKKTRGALPAKLGASWLFCLTFIQIPKPVDWEKHILQGSEDWRRQKVVSELFEERQIWVKESLAERLRDGGLKLGESRIKRLLFRVAYYFSSGPFRRFWIRKGYDPRKDPESRIYQNIDFRVLPELRSYCESHASSGLKHRWDDICAFRVFPYKCQISLQLCELKDNYIQQEIRKPSNQETCDNTTGWFSSHILDCLRLCIAVRFMSVCPHPDAESLLKTVSARFEKSKRIHTCVKVTRSEEQGKVHKEAENNEVDDQAENNEVDEPDYLEDDEDDFEDDNVEDEMDAYEPLDLVGQEGDVSIHDDPHTNHDNVSRDYLQELFGNFPFSTAGVDEVQDDQSLGEYQIYDQYIDGSYSEDEDY